MDDQTPLSAPLGTSSGVPSESPSESPPGTPPGTPPKMHHRSPPHEKPYEVIDVLGNDSPRRHTIVGSYRHEDNDEPEIIPEDTTTTDEPKRCRCSPAALGMRIVRVFFPNAAFTKLLIYGLIPAINALVPLFYTGQIPDSSALAITSQYIFVSIMLEICQESVVNSLYHLVGRDYKDKRLEALQILKICALILCIMGVVLCALVVVFIDQLVVVINTPDSIVEDTKQYLYISAFSYPLILVNAAIKNHLQITTHALILASSLCIVVSTILLNVFLFGTQAASAHWGVEHLGTYKIIESLVNFLTDFFFFFLIEKMSPVTFVFRVPLVKELRHKLKAIFDVSWGNFGDSLVRNFFYFVVTLQFVNYLGPDEAAAWNLVNAVVWTFLLIPTYALANHVKIAIGLHADLPHLKRRIRVVAAETGYAMCAWLLLVGTTSALCWPAIAALFSPNNTNVQQISQLMFYSIGWVFIVFSVSSALSGLFYGTGKTRYIFYQSFISNMLVYFVPWVLYLAGVLVPTNWYVFGLYAAGMVVSLVLTIVFCLKLWKKM